MKKVALVLAAVAGISSNVAMAEDINPWKHCGLGAMVFDDNGTAAAISNLIWDLGTTAISSKVSSEDSCEGQRVAAAQFIQDNFKTVIEQTSVGEGTHLNAMLDILAVADENKADVIASVRSAVAANQNMQPEAFYSVVIAAI